MKLILTERAKICVSMLSQVYKLKGDVIELGCRKGMTSISLARYLKREKSNKKVYAYDCFGGLPYDGGEFDNETLKKGELPSTLEILESNIEKYRVKGIVIPVIGLVEETLKDFDEDRKICFIWLDMDLYKPTSISVKMLKNKIVIGGIIGFHDYGFKFCPGIKKVVKEELDPNEFDIIHLYETCAFFRRVK